MERIDFVLIGAGVVGLAVARELACRGREVVVLEAADRIGTGTSSRNSEVVHAGLYYPVGSLKSRLCTEGNQALYSYCAANGISHRRCGKLIVATDERQIKVLERIRKHAEANGVTDLYWLTGSRAMALEPEIFCVAALLSPRTGIVDSHASGQARPAGSGNGGAQRRPDGRSNMNETRNTLATAYGRADKRALRDLQDTYDTSGLLRMVDELDAILVEAREEDGLRDRLLRLHGMAHTVINGAGM